MKSRLILLLVLIGLLIWPVTIAAQVNGLTADQWREDVEFFAEQFPSRHPDPFRQVSEATFKAEVDLLLDELPTLSDAEIIVRIDRLVSMIVDGHTSMVPNYEAFYPLSHYLLRFYRFEDGIYLVKAAEPYQKLVGTKLVQVGMMDIDSAYALLEQIAPHDNEWTQRYTTPFQLNIAVHLLGSGIIQDIEEPNFVLETEDGETITLNPEPITFNDFIEFIGNEYSFPVREDILYLSNRDAFWVENFEDQQTIYMQYNSVRTLNSERVTIAEMAHEIQEVINAGEVERLIIDLRNNPGGDIGTFAPLMNLLTMHEFFQGPGSLLILIGRQTFSAAVVFSLRLEDTINPIFLGEPTGGQPNMFENARPLTLSNSGLVINVSSRARRDGGPDDMRTAVEPSIMIPLTAAEYFEGNDPVLEAALNYQP